MIISRINCNLEELAVAELKAIIKAYSPNSKIVFKDDCIVGFTFDNKIDVLKRLALTKYIGKLIYKIEYKNIDSLNNLNLKINNYYIESDYIKGYGKKYKWIKHEILKRINGKICYKNPKHILICIYTSKHIYLCEKLLEISKKEYMLRKPSKRPFSRPGALDPVISRAVVNTTGIKPGETFLDAFCGTGSLLIEAALIGCKIYGTDLDEIMLKGCKENLKFFKISDFQLFRMDAREIYKYYEEFFDAIASDLPYGRSTKTFGIKLEKLYYEACFSLYNALKKGRYICLVSTRESNLEDIMKDVGFKIEDICYQYVHGSLTRKFVIGRKN